MRRESTHWGIIFIWQLQPVLYWLHRTVPAKLAPSYFRALHGLVYYWPYDYRSTHKALVNGTETLLRILCFGPDFVSCQGKGYCWNNFRYSLCKYMEYFVEVGDPLFPAELTIENMNDCAFYDLMGPCCQKFQQWNDRLAKVHSEHAEWVRFVYALIAHLSELETSGQFLDVGKNVQGPVYELAAGLLRRGFSFDLPKEEGQKLEDLRSDCEHAWEKIFPSQD